MERSPRYLFSEIFENAYLYVYVAPFYGFYIEGYLTFTPHNDDDDTAHLSDSQFLLSKQEETYENHC